MLSEHVINDIWTRAKGVNLSEEWTGTSRFQILRTRLPEGYEWVDGRPMKIQKTTRSDSKWPEASTQLSKEQTQLQNGPTNVPNCKQHAATGASTRYRPMTKITSR